MVVFCACKIQYGATEVFLGSSFCSEKMEIVVYSLILLFAHEGHTAHRNKFGAAIKRYVQVL